MSEKKMSSAELGKKGEDLASSFLLENNISIIERNIRTDYGEIDILGEENGTLIFFEVKTRRSKLYGNPEDAVNKIKKEHMVNSALDYLQSYPGKDVDWRIDVIAINIGKQGEINFEWFKNAIIS